MNFLSSKDILALRQRRVIEVDVAELGGAIRLMQFSQGGAERFTEINDRREKGDKNANRDAVVFLLTQVAVNENRRPLFTETEANSLVDGLPLDKMMALNQAIIQHLSELLPQPKEGEAGNS